MKAAFVQQPGPADTIQYGDLPDPTPVGRQVLVKTAAVSVNPIDTYIRGGAVKVPNLPSPFVIGADVAGVVVAVGPEATRFKIGDRVWGSNQGMQGRQGTFAELCAIDEEWLYPIPPHVDEASAAAVALVGITAQLGLVQRAKLQPGETIFVTGGTGGVGSCVVQMAKALGARVIATAGSEEKAEIARGLGADEVILYKSEDVAARIRELAPHGVNVFWETTTSPDFEVAFPLLAFRGRFVLMAGRPARPIFPAGAFYTKDCTLHGFAMFNASPDEQRVASVDINRWMVEGRLKPRICCTLPLGLAHEAHKMQEESTTGKSGSLSGKIVLTV